jgi:transposase
MSKMSVRSAAKIMMCSWDTLDNIVDRVVSEYLDRMDLSCVTRIRIDETSAKKHHRYITVVTDVDTGDIIFMTKGKDSDTVKEFRDWLVEHNGDPEQISVVASDFGDAFLSGVREYLPNAEPVLDPFHLIQLGNMKLDADRASCQENGERKKSIRYALLRNPENFKPGDAEIVMDIKNDNKGLGLSYEMNMSLRQAFEHPYVELARIHLLHWVEWVEEEGSKNFKALAKTVKRHLEGILNAMRFNINNGYQEGLNGRIQFTKRVANGYHKESRLMRMVFFRESAVRSRG